MAKAGNGSLNWMDDRIELNKYVAAIWRGKWLILAAVVLAGLGTAAYQYRQPATYTAGALIRIGRVWKEPLEDPFLTAEIINSQGFHDDIAHKISIKPGLLRRAIKATAVTAGPQRTSYPILVRIVASTDSADESGRLVDSVASELVARHQTIFDQAMAPHLETQHRLEELERLAEAAPSPPLDARVKLQQDLGEVKSSNTSPTITERTHLLGPVAREGVSRAEIWQPAAIAAFSAGLVAIAAAVLIALLGATPRAAEAAVAGKELSDVTPG